MGNLIQGISHPGDWKIMPGQDRKNGEVKTYKLSPDELERYLNTATYQKPSVMNLKLGCQKGEDQDMNKMPFTTEELLEECRIYGTNAKAQRILAQKYNLTPKQISNQITHKKIIEKLGVTINKNAEPRILQVSEKRLRTAYLQGESADYKINSTTISIVDKRHEEMFIDIAKCDIKTLIQELYELQNRLESEPA